MLNQFYRYLSHKLINYFNNNSVKAGNRYYVEFQNSNQVKEFYEDLKEVGKGKNFIYKHSQGGEYNTYSIDIDGVRLVVASSLDVTKGYLVTLRNASKEQEGVFNNAALLILCDNQIDSIKDGGSDLSKDGMPFSVKAISENIIDEIDSINMKKSDKEILKFYVNKKLSDVYSNSLWDYEEVLSMIEKKIIEDEDYKEIGIFRDNGIDTINNAKSIQKRLKENEGLYSKVNSVQDYEDKETQLEKDFDLKVAKNLVKDNWRELDFGIVKKSYEANKKSKPLIFDRIITSEKENISFWTINKDETASGKRKKSIIIFNNGISREIEMEFLFDDRLYTEFISKKSKEFASVSGKKLKIKIKADRYNPKFYKISYNHKNQSKSKYDFSIVVLNIREEDIKNIKTKFNVKTGSGNKNRIEIFNNGEEIIFGHGNAEKEFVVTEVEKDINFSDGNRVIISSNSDWEEGVLRFVLETKEGKAPFELKDEALKSKLINSVKLYKYKRENQESFEIINNKLIQGTNEWHLDEKHRYTLDKEREIIKKRILFGQEVLNVINKIDIDLDQDIKEIYEKIFKFYEKKQSIPSLLNLDKEIIEIYKELIEIFNSKIESIKELDIIGNNEKVKNLLKLGSYYSDEKIIFTPLSPINIAYILEIYSQLALEKVDTHILERLNPNNLLPYIYDGEDNLYRPIYQKENAGWLVFENKDKVSIGQTNAFVAKVIKEKLNQFISHFYYLFSNKSNAPIRINVINIKNDIEVVKGICDFIKSQVEKGKNNIIPIEVTVYNDGNESFFEKFLELNSPEKIKAEFHINFNTKDSDLEEVDVLKILLNNITYYKEGKNKKYKYAHISFFKPGEDDKEAEHNVEDLESGLSIGGLLSSITYNNKGNDYRIGFGKNNLIAENDLIRTAVNINELAANLKNDGQNSYRKSTSIVTRPLTIEKDEKRNLYGSSNWVTFIEPNFGIEYFNNNLKDDVIIIHYSDQYTSSSQYDTITITQKSKQYKSIICEYLENKNIMLPEERINEVIKSFNSINGDWLLNLLSCKSQYDREKLSIISALKYSLSILNHKDIIWVPASLEEILRISGAVKLNKSEGLFTIKNLKEKGIHSDDLIFIGVNVKNKQELKVYIYPIEVKIGYNFESVILKGKNQIDKTFKLLLKQLRQECDEEGKKIFKNKFFRNFFMTLLITNAQKLYLNEFWPEKNYFAISELKSLLLNDDYKLSFELNSLIGKGALVSFKKENHWRKMYNEDGILYIELIEEDAYKGIGDRIKEINQLVNSENFDIPNKDLLNNKSLENLEELNIGDILNKEDNEEFKRTIESIEGYQDNEYEDEKNDIENKEDEKEFIEIKGIEVDEHSVKEKIDRLEGLQLKQTIDTNEEIVNYPENVRVLLGEVKGSSSKIYWEFGNKRLANRHMIITGKSGNGKTYFIQTAILELAKQGVPSIVIDYTDGYKASQLEPEFKEYLGDNLKQYFVAKDKFPLNPFKKSLKQLDEDYFIEEDSVDVAERFRSIISAVYSTLGPQQLNSIYEAVIRGLEKYDNKLTLKEFRKELEEDSSSNAKTALSQLRLFLDKDPFKESAHFDWGEILKGGKVFIIQLTGFQKEIQRIITEVVLWDLWNYKTQHGDKNKPFAVVLDEAQNLNFSENAPSTKILTEGRKFGWSAWFSTQFFKGQMDKATISRLQNAAEKIYFAQTEEEASDLANNLTSNGEQRKNMTKKLRELDKGSCIIYSPIKNSNGNLISAKTIEINITSLKDRIKINNIKNENKIVSKF